MIDAIGLPAGGALIAGVIRQSVAVDRLGQLEGCELLSHPVRSVKEVRVSQAVLDQGRSQASLRDFLADDVGKRHGEPPYPLLHWAKWRTGWEIES
jgi:hypothetical protein